MRPPNLKTKIFLDSGDPKETKEALDLLGFLDGQTTNPTLFSKNQQVAARIARGEKFSQKEVLDFYKKTAREISDLIPRGSISLEVYADEKTKSEDIIEQAKNLFSWIPNAHIKIPIVPAGLEASAYLIKQGLRVNFTLCFSQEQAAAVYSATRGAKKGQVFLSPFVGRLDDRGENGMDLIKNMLRMYQKGDGHIMLLTASVRNLNHLLCAIDLGSDIATLPPKVLKEWAEKKFPMPDKNYQYPVETLKPIPYQELDLNSSWESFNLSHQLTEIGLANFAKDWNSLIEQG